MEKVLTAILAIALLYTGVFFGYEYVSEPKIIDGRTSKSLTADGKPINAKAEFAPDEPIYFSARQLGFG